MATSGRSALSSSTSTGSKSTLENPNPEDDDGQDLWWDKIGQMSGLYERGFGALGLFCFAGMRMV